MLELKCECGEQMCQEDSGVDNTDVHFTLNFSCSCGATAEISFDMDTDIEFTDGNGETSTKNYYDLT